MPHLAVRQLHILVRDLSDKLYRPDHRRTTNPLRRPQSPSRTSLVMVPASTDLAATDLIEHIMEGAGTKERSSTIGTMVLLDSA